VEENVIEESGFNTFSALDLDDNFFSVSVNSEAEAPV
jgi:hypothetical protein